LSNAAKLARALASRAKENRAGVRYEVLPNFSRSTNPVVDAFFQLDAEYVNPGSSLLVSYQLKMSDEAIAKDARASRRRIATIRE
jgi:hypothetical protein